MIPPNFSKTVEYDYKLLFNALVGEENFSDNNRIKYVAIRAISSFGIVIGAIKTISSVLFFATHPIGSLCSLALGVSLMIVSRDVFIMAQNKDPENAPFKIVTHVAKSKAKDCIDKLKGNKHSNSHNGRPILFITENTLLRPFWNQLVLKKYGIK